MKTTIILTETHPAESADTKEVLQQAVSAWLAEELFGPPAREEVIRINALHGS